MILKTRPISKRHFTKHQLGRLIDLAKCTTSDGTCLKEMLSADETFRQLAEGVGGKWQAKIITVMEFRRCDTRPLADDNPETEYVATIAVEEEFTLLIDGRNFGEHRTPRTFVNAVFDCLGLFPTPLY
jgi:hypothetical protein